MKDPEKGMKELNLEKDKKVFNHCFTGKCGALLKCAAEEEMRLSPTGFVCAGVLRGCTGVQNADW